jgi:hypothetical protein
MMCISEGMKQPKNPSKNPLPQGTADEPRSVMFDFIDRGRRAQEVVNRVLAEHRRTPRPKGKA